MAYDPDGGMSTRQIGAALGVGKSTIDRDLAGVPDGTPEPRRVQGSDGRARHGNCPKLDKRTAPRTAANDIAASEQNCSDGPRRVQSSDGIVRTYQQPTEEERAQRFKEAHERLIDEGVAPGPRTEEVEQAD